MTRAVVAALTDLKRSRVPETRTGLLTHFEELPDRDEYPDYYEVITQPLSFADIRRRIADVQATKHLPYDDPGRRRYVLADFVRDVQRIVANARRYNLPRAAAFQHAIHLERRCKEVVEAVRERGLAVPSDDESDDEEAYERSLRYRKEFAALEQANAKEVEAENARQRAERFLRARPRDSVTRLSRSLRRGALNDLDLFDRGVEDTTVYHHRKIRGTIPVGAPLPEDPPGSMANPLEETAREAYWKARSIPPPTPEEDELLARLLPGGDGAGRGEASTDAPLHAKPLARGTALHKLAKILRPKAPTPSTSSSHRRRSSAKSTTPEDSDSDLDADEARELTKHAFGDILERAQSLLAAGGLLNGVPPRARDAVTPPHHVAAILVDFAGIRVSGPTEHGEEPEPLRPDESAAAHPMLIPLARSAAASIDPVFVTAHPTLATAANPLLSPFAAHTTDMAAAMDTTTRDAPARGRRNPSRAAAPPPPKSIPRLSAHQADVSNGRPHPPPPIPMTPTVPQTLSRIGRLTLGRRRRGEEDPPPADALTTLARRASTMDELEGPTPAYLRFLVGGKPSAPLRAVLPPGFSPTAVTRAHPDGPGYGPLGPAVPPSRGWKWSIPLLPALRPPPTPTRRRAPPRGKAAPAPAPLSALFTPPARTVSPSPTDEPLPADVAFNAHRVRGGVWLRGDEEYLGAGLARLAGRKRPRSQPAKVRKPMPSPELSETSSTTSSGSEPGSPSSGSVTTPMSVPDASPSSDDASEALSSFHSSQSTTPPPSTPSSLESSGSEPASPPRKQKSAGKAAASKRTPPTRKSPTRKPTARPRSLAKAQLSEGSEDASVTTSSKSKRSASTVIHDLAVGEHVEWTTNGRKVQGVVRALVPAAVVREALKQSSPALVRRWVAIANASSLWDAPLSVQVAEFPPRSCSSKPTGGARVVMEGIRDGSLPNDDSSPHFNEPGGVSLMTVDFPPKETLAAATAAARGRSKGFPSDGTSTAILVLVHAPLGRGRKGLDEWMSICFLSRSEKKKVRSKRTG